MYSYKAPNGGVIYGPRPQEAPRYVLVIIALVAVLVAYLILSAGFNRQEIRECAAWVHQPGPFVQWQIDQCKAHQVDLTK